MAGGAGVLDFQQRLRGVVTGMDLHSALLEHFAAGVAAVVVVVNQQHRKAAALRWRGRWGDGGFPAKKPLEVESASPSEVALMPSANPPAGSLGGN